MLWSCRRRDPRSETERAWLGSHSSRGASALDLVLAAPVFATAAGVDAHTAANLLRQMATGAAHGTPVTVTLNMLADLHGHSAPAGAVCADLASTTARGSRLSDALNAHPATFPTAVTALVAAGERVGQVSSALEQAAAVLSDDADTAAQVRTAISQPAAAAVVLATLTGALTFVATPLLAPIARGGDLPALTALALATARYLPVVLVAAAVAAVLLGVLRRNSTVGTAVRQRVDTLVAHSPGTGTLARQRAHARLASTLAWTLTSGLTGSEALRIAAPVAGNVEYTEAALRAADAAGDSAALAGALAAEPLLAPLAPLVATGERTGTSAPLLRQHADALRRESGRTAQAIAGAAQTWAAAAAGLIVLGWLLTALLPVLLTAR